MKSLIRFCSVFSCFVLLFAVFSLPASAAEVPFNADKAHVVLWSGTAGYTFGQVDVAVGESGTAQGSVYHKLTSGVEIKNQVILANSDGSIVLPSGSKYTVTIENITFRSNVRQDSGSNIELSFGHNVDPIYNCYLIYADGTRSPSIDSDQFELILNGPKDNHSLKIEIEENSKDILKIEINEWIAFHSETVFDSNYGYLEGTSGFVYPLKISIEKEDKSIGLLEGLLAWVKEIGEKVRDSFDVISSGFANIGTWFAELPGKIWSVMENGIKGLFVPDQSYMEEYSDKWDGLLADRLGAVYQVCDIVHNSWESIMSADETNTIEFPEVTIPLPDDNEFSFGGYDVKIVPDGFTALATAVKSAVGILCTYLFVNGLLKRYDEVMGVKE